jgi:EmrB/QacA subfamily drug resistance transporter
MREQSLNRWQIVAVLSIVQFMLFLDDTIVNVALPAIDDDLDMSRTALAWIINAYVLLYGGLLLLGGRLADVAGKVRLFVIGVSVFGLGSLLSGLAPTGDLLVMARGLQGVGAAAAAPAALAIVVSLFDEPGERARAMAIWTGLAGIAATLGAVLGGVITDLVSWRFIFLINIPLVLVALIYVRTKLPTSERTIGGTFDFRGAVLSTAGVMLLAFTLLEANEAGWLSARTLAGFAGAAALIALFVASERRIDQPLVPLFFFSLRRRTTGLALQYLLAAVLFGLFFLGTLYLQQVLGYSPLEGGLAWLAFFVGFFIGAASGGELIFRVGARAVIAAGLVLTALGLVWFAEAPTDASYFTHVAGPLLVAGLGLAWGYIPVAVVIMDGVPEQQEGLASGLLATGQQIGGAIGLSVFVSIAETRTGDLLTGGTAPGEAQVGGTGLAWLVAAAVCVVGALITFRLLGRWIPARPHAGGHGARAEPAVAAPEPSP